MNILLTGASGQLGTELSPLLHQLGKVSSLNRNLEKAASFSLDLVDLNGLEILLNRLKPDLIVNTAAYTAVDQAENNCESAFRLNAEVPACLARWCAANQKPLLHYSTDYVFDGESDRPYREDDATAPINVYGDSKRAGELAIRESGCLHVILRTSWVYSSHGNNFLLTMLRLARQRSELSVVSDQAGCPTWARNLASVSLQILQQLHSREDWEKYTGTYHYCDATVTTWYDFAQMIFRQATELGVLKTEPALKAIKSDDFPQLATRPKYSILDTRLLRDRFGVMPPGLEPSLRECLQACQT